MILIEKAVKILDKNLCDHCLGSQFAILLSGYTNEERGRFVRNIIGVMIDSDTIDSSKIDPSNFYDFKFRINKKFSKAKKKKCWLCDDVFDDLEKYADMAEKKLKKIEFNTFLVGASLSDEILIRQEKIWEKIGIDYCEPVKNSITRELGKNLEKRMKKGVEFKRPDVVVHVDLVEKKIYLQVNSLFVFGFYKKMKRGIPQSEWGTPGMYKTSIQQIIAKPLEKATKSRENKFSGSGREDIDARCLGWRSFVIEMLEPVKRKMNLREIQKKINKSKKVNVKELKFSDKRTVVHIKTNTGDKTYRVLAKLDKPVDKKDLVKLRKLIGVIKQRTPNRVSARRADLVRKRRVKSIKYKLINKKTIELTIESVAGLYIKELVSSDGGRTIPSVAGILGVKAVSKDLDVIHIERPKGL